MKLFLLLLRFSWPTVVLASLIGGVSGGATVGLIAIIHHTLSDTGTSLQLLASLFAGVCVIVLLTQIASQLILIRLSQGVTQRLSQHLCERILAAPLRQLEEKGTHRLLAVLTSDVLIIAQALNGVPVMCVSLVTLACGMAYLAWLSLPLFLGMLLFLILGVGSYLLTSAPGTRYLKIGREHRDTLMRHVRTLIDGTKELKLHRERREVFLNEVMRLALDDVRHYQVAGRSIQAASVSWGRMLFFAAMGLVLFVWPQYEPIEKAALAGYVLTILYLVSPMDQILGWMPMFVMAGVSVRKIEELGLSIDATEEEECSAAPVGEWKVLEMVGVTHTYYRENEGDGFTLGPIDLTLAPGELVFLVGGNGCGKTTLAKLLTGLYTPEQGDIRLDGVPISDNNREEYRQLFTAVFAEAVLFESLLGLEGQQLDERAREYLEQLHLDRAVSVSDGVFSTTELSKGQRKRLTLLTAYLEDRPIYVFDEWAADQDPVFKEVFYRKILPDLKARGKALLVITHDDRYFNVADRVVALCDGEMVHGDWELAQTLAEGGRPDRRPSASTDPFTRQNRL